MALIREHLRYLGGLAHNLEPVVMVGKDGVSDGVIGALEQALLDHELVKVKLGSNTPEERQAAAQILADRCSAELVKVVGKVVILFRAHPDKPTIKLPRVRKK